MHARKNLLSPTTLATYEAGIYSYAYVDCAIVHTYATSQANHVFAQTIDFSCMRFLVVWVSVITCIIVTLLRQVVSSLSPIQETYLQFSVNTEGYILNICSLIHPGITLEPVLQPRTWVTPSRAFSMIESMAEA